MSIQTMKLGAAALLAGALLAGPVQAQTAAPAAPAGAPAAPAEGAPQAPQVDPTKPIKFDMLVTPGTDWLKVCGTPPGQKETCYITRDFTIQQGQPPIAAVAVYDMKGEDSRQVRILMPTELLIKPGIHASVDKGATIDGSFELCMPNGCFSSLKINGKQLDAMKKGATFNVIAKNRFGGEMTFAMPLGNFGKAFDGPAKTEEEIRKAQEAQIAAAVEMQKQLQARAQAQRQQLEQQGAAPAAGTAPAPAAPAPKP